MNTKYKMNNNLKTVTLYNLPTEILLQICENLYIVDDLISLYKTCKLFKYTIDNYKTQLLYKLFLSNDFSNSYYNLFFSFINDHYEYIKNIPYKRLNDLLKWQYYDEEEKNKNQITKILITYFTDINKFRQSLIDDCLPIFRNFMCLLHMPTRYIYGSSILLYKFFNTRGLYNIKNTFVIVIKMQKELNYYNIMSKGNNNIYTLNNTDISIFEVLIDIYPNLLLKHLLNFKYLMSDKKYTRLLHNFIINLFLEWLFENECDFIETIYYKLYLHFPNFVQKTIYRIIYNEFQILYHVSSDEFVEEFYNIHRIFIPSSKILRLYNTLNLENYRRIIEHNNLDWKYNLKCLEIFN